MTQTPEEKTAQQEELNKRVGQFNEKLKPLLKEFNLVLGANPIFTPDGRVTAIPQVYDATELKKQQQPAQAEAPAPVKDEPLSEA